MMNRQWIIAAILLVSLVLTGCSRLDSVDASLGQEFSLGIGQSAVIEGENLQVNFKEVIADSRCAEGALCVWEGEASCLVEITYQGLTAVKVLTQPGTNVNNETGFGDYWIAFNLTPYPRVGESIKKGDYRLHLTIDQKFALSGGVLAAFDVLGEKYNIFVTNKETIEQILALQRGESQAKIPSGRLLKGPVAYNQPWSWHIDPEDIHMAELTIELCDGLPSQIEENLDYWVDTVRRFCPWHATLVSIQDYR